MDNKEHQTCGQGVFLDCLGLKVVGGETSALYTYALLKRYVLIQRDAGTLCRRSLSEPPFSIDGKHTNILSMIVDKKDVIKFTSELSGMGINYIWVATGRNDFDMVFASDAPAVERALRQNDLKIQSWCLYSTKDVKLAYDPKLEPFNEDVGIVRGITATRDSDGNVRFVWSEDKYWEDWADLAKDMNYLISGASKEQLKKYQVESVTVDELAKKAEESLERQKAFENGELGPDGKPLYGFEDLGTDSGLYSDVEIMGNKVLENVIDLMKDKTKEQINFDNTIVASDTISMGL